jgi:hypothetical protein
MTRILDTLAKPTNLRKLALALIVLVTVAVVSGMLAIAVAFHAITSTNEGRRIGSAITCATNSAIIDAGRVTIESGATINPHRFAQALEHLGLPPDATRKQAAMAAARAYARKISRTVVKQSGIHGVIRADGSLDCAAVRRAAKITG